MHLILCALALPLFFPTEFDRTFTYNEQVNYEYFGKLLLQLF